MKQESNYEGRKGRQRRAAERLQWQLDNFAEHAKRQSWTLDEAEPQRARIKRELATLKSRA